MRRFKNILNNDKKILRGIKIKIKKSRDVLE